MVTKRDIRKVAMLEQQAVVNRATAAELINNGADGDFAKELIATAEAQEAKAAKLREPVKRRQRGTA